MIKAERDRLRRLANDSIIATFGSDTTEAQLAQSLETCIDELDNVATECENCKTCEAHGDFEDDTLDIDVDKVLSLHGELSKQVQSLKDLHVRLAEALVDSDEELASEFASRIEELEGYVDELEAEVIP